MLVPGRGTATTAPYDTLYQQALEFTKLFNTQDTHRQVLIAVDSVGHVSRINLPHVIILAFMLDLEMVKVR